MAKGFLYLVVIMDWTSRRVLAWRLSNTMEANFCVEALEDALTRARKSSIPTKFTSYDFTNVLKREVVKISMDGKGRFMDNIFIERRSVKYEEVFIKAYATVAEARASIDAYLAFYNDERPHQSFKYQTPRQVFDAGLWTIGFASPMSPAKAGNMWKGSP